MTIAIREDAPAVNVKVRGSLEAAKLPEDAPAGFTVAWARANVSQDALDQYWELSCEAAWERLQNDATEIFGKDAKVYADGRSNGWARVEGIGTPDEWDEAEAEKWARFEVAAREQANAVLPDLLYTVYLNEWAASQGIAPEDL